MPEHLAAGMRRMHAAGLARDQVPAATFGPNDIGKKSDALAHYTKNNGCVFVSQSGIRCLYKYRYDGPRSQSCQKRHLEEKIHIMDSSTEIEMHNLNAMSSPDGRIDEAMHKRQITQVLIGCGILQFPIWGMVASQSCWTQRLT